MNIIKIDFKQINSTLEYGPDLSNLGYGPMAGSCEYGNEPSGSVRGGVLLDMLSDSRDSLSFSRRTLVL
jgi:hypothetical protein